MPTVRRDSTTQKIARNPTTQKAVAAGEVGGSCCCGDAGGCCGSDCILATFTDWVDEAGNAFPFVNNGGDPWKLQRIAFCHFVYDCAANETIEGIHYDQFVIDAYIPQHGDGTMFIQSLVGYLISDDGSGAIYIFPPNNGMDAPSPGCDQTITAGIDEYPSAELTIEYASGEDCTDEDCEAPDSCTLCCPDVTCAEITVTYTAEFDIAAGGETLSYSYTFPLDRGPADLSDCWYAGNCSDPESGNVDRQAVAHIICDDEGGPQLLNLGFIDFTTGVAFLVNDPVGISCSGSTSPTITHTFVPGNIVAVTDASITFELKDFCDQVENCTSTPIPDECPEPCIECSEACGERCWVGATLTIEYAIATGECGTCASYGDPPFGDNGCRKCSSCALAHDPTGGGTVHPSECPDYTVFNDADCLTHDPPGFIYCATPCTEEGGGGSSVCSFIDYSGSIELVSSIVGDEIHFTGLLTFDDDTLAFDVWYDCSEERWYGKITVNGTCIFTGDLGGFCNTFPGLSLAGNDTGLPGSANCELVGTLGGAAVEFADYVCPPEE